MRRLLGLTFTLLFLASPARAAHLSLGANGALMKGVSGRESFDLALSLPFDDALHRPGFRVGVADEHRNHEIFMDVGATVLKSSYEVYRSVTVTGNYQHSLKQEGSVTQYVTLGGGLTTQGVSARTDTRAVYGGGLGIRQTVADDHGSVRVELRVERIADAMTLAGVKFGFDLWLK